MNSIQRGLAMCFTFGLLYGCAAPKPVVPEPVLIARKTTVNVPPALLKDCATQLPALTDQKYSQGQTLTPIQQWANTYTDCQLRFKYVRDLMVEALNINVDPNAPAQGAVVDAPPASGTVIASPAVPASAVTK